MLSQHSVIERIVAVIGGFLLFFFGLLTMSWIPYLSGGIVLISGLKIMTHKSGLDILPIMFKETTLMTKLSIGTILLHLPIICLFLDLAFAPVFFIESNLFFSGVSPGWAENVKRLHEVTLPLFCSIAVSYFFCGLCSVKNFVAISKTERKGWNTEAFYCILRNIMVTSGVTTLVINFVSLWYEIVVQKNVLANLLTCFCVLLPYETMFIFGRKRCFSAMARYFEYDSSRMKEDGALLAELVTISSQAYIMGAEKQKYWIHRHFESKYHIDNKDNTYVSRNKWMLGEVEKVAHDFIFVKVSYTMDSSRSWNAFISKDGTMTIEQDTCAIEKNCDDENFEDWITENFTVEDLATVDSDLDYVIVKKSVNCAVESQVLKEWASSNLRFFDMRNFYDELLNSSVRKKKELIDNSDDDSLISLSKIFAPQFGTDRIDYFISHCWCDNSEQKCRALREFLKPNAWTGQYPTCWLDKVCIDQRNIDNAVSALPIFVASCRKVLVLLSPNYLKRLWCIWEIFTVLTFCQKELATERIEFLFIDNGEGFTRREMLQMFVEFDLSQARCYDPTEEIKLRRILDVIGVQRLRDTLQGFYETLARDHKFDAHHVKSHFSKQVYP